MRPLLTLCALLIAPAAWADAPRTSVSEEAYERAVDLVERLYLGREGLEEVRLLQSAATGLADELHWLVVEAEADAVYLRHGNGTPIGSVSVATDPNHTLQYLPEALRMLETVVLESGYDTGEVDVRLEILKGMTTGLDRYSRVLAGEKLERFDVRLKGTLVGVGATIERSGAELVIRSVVEGGPADRGGLQVGDAILRIDGVSTVNMPLREATNRIRGEIDTQVRLTVRRGKTETLELQLARAEVPVENVKHERLADNVGYVRIDHFSQRTVENLQTSLAELRAMGALERGLVLDLRGNTGGSMKEAARSADQFLAEGMLLRTEGPQQQPVQNLQARMEAVAEPNEPAIPIVVLVDDQTASGSEILAGALLELDRAALVGYVTYGKGTVQKIYNLDEHARLKLTVAEYILENDRRISDGGLVPDALVGGIEIDALGVRYRGWEESRSRVPWEEIVPSVRERAADGAWPQDDFARELARRAVLRAKAPTRDATVAALREVVPQMRAEQEARLVAAYTARGIDWSEVDASTLATGSPNAVVRLVTIVDPARPDSVEVRAEVQNLGTEPLHRVLVELECDTFRPWSGLVIPVGRVEPNGTGEGRVSVELHPGIDPREDVVRVKLRSDRRLPLELADEVLRSSSSPVPRVAVSARVGGQGDQRRAEVTVRNLSNQRIEGLEVSFAHPGDVDVELLDAQAWLPALDARAEARVDLGLVIGPNASPTLPLEIEIESTRYARLANWPIDLPADGTAVAVEAPRIQVRNTELSAPVGQYVLSLQALDERAIDHVVVYQNGTKVAWAGGGRNRVDLRAELEIEPGTNQIVILAEDDQGLVTRRNFLLRGETSAAVDADTAED